VSLLLNLLRDIFLRVSVRVYFTLSVYACVRLISFTVMSPKSKPRAGVVSQQPAAVVLAMMPIDAEAHSVVSQR
jgi:hypothetical protein